MIRIALLIFALVVATTLLFPVPAGWAWALVLTGVAAWYLRARSQAAYRWVTFSAIWKCPYCLTAKPLGTTSCRYCGSDLIVAKETNEPPEPEPERDLLPATTPPERAIVDDVAGTLETITRSLSHAARALRLIADPQPPAPPPPPLELLPQPTTEEDLSTHDPPPP